jgi:hypothetical protein
MKLPGRIQSYLDELDLEGGVKAKLKKHIASMGEALPEHPTPKEVEKIVKGSMKNLKISIGTSEDEDEPKKEKPKAEKVEESKKQTFKEFLNEGRWSTPTTPEQKAKLKALLDNPLLAKNAINKLYNLIGDDELFDLIDDAISEDPTTDVRAIVNKFLKTKKIDL